MERFLVIWLRCLLKYEGRDCVHASSGQELGQRGRQPPLRLGCQRRKMAHKKLSPGSEAQLFWRREVLWSSVARQMTSKGVQSLLALWIWRVEVT